MDAEACRVPHAARQPVEFNRAVRRPLSRRAVEQQPVAAVHPRRPVPRRMFPDEPAEVIALRSALVRSHVLCDLDHDQPE